MADTLPQSEVAFRQALAVGDFVLTNPMPCWCKDYTDMDNPIYLWISRSYEDIYGVRREDFEGYGDKDVWPPDVAEIFLKHDLETINNGLVTTTESAPAKDPKWRDIKVAKWCVEQVSFNQTYRFVYGIAGPLYEQ